jgi:hypothetical protein
MALHELRTAPAVSLFLKVVLDCRTPPLVPESSNVSEKRY